MRRARELLMTSTGGWNEMEVTVKMTVAPASEARTDRSRDRWRGCSSRSQGRTRWWSRWRGVEQNRGWGTDASSLHKEHIRTQSWKLRHKREARQLQHSNGEVMIEKPAWTVRRGDEAEEDSQVKEQGEKRGRKEMIWRWWSAQHKKERRNSRRQRLQDESRAPSRKWKKKFFDKLWPELVLILYPKIIIIKNIS